MGITNTTRYKSGTDSIALNSEFSSASGGLAMIADPGAGYKIAIEHLLITCAADDAVSLREDSSAFFGPITFKVAGPMVWQHQFMNKDDGKGALLLTANKELQVITTGSSAGHIYCEYHILKEA